MSGVMHFAIIICTAVLMFSLEGECCILPNIGNMTLDHDVLVGTDLILNCYLYSNIYIMGNNTTVYVNSSSLLFKHSDKEMKDVKIIDEFTLQLRIQNASGEEHSGSYFCYLDVPHPSLPPKRKLVCVGYYNVGYAPLPAENFNCRGLHFRTLKCTWGIPFNRVKTNYTLYDNIRGKNHCNFNFVGLERICPIRQYNSCEWTLESSPQYMQSRKRLCLKLVGENNLGRNVQYFELEHYAIVVPGRPDGLSINKHTSTSFAAFWLVPHDMRNGNFPPGLTYEVQYKANYSRSWQVRKLGSQMELNITNLIPHTSYQFLVRCRSPLAVGDDMWSESTNATVHTDPDVPYLAPEVTPGIFETHKADDEWNITLHWKPIPEEHWNAPKFNYSISYTETHISRGRRSVSSNQTVNPNQSHAFFYHLNPHSSYEFVLYAVNEEGQSRNVSTVKVPREEIAPLVVNDIKVVYNSGKYEVSWENPSQEKDKVLSYTVFWCKMFQPGDHLCLEPINWRSVPAEKNRLQLNLGNQKELFQFGVAPIAGNNITSGMRWARCLVKQGGVFNKIDDVRLESLSPYNIKVMWNVGCPARKHVLQEYKISYCPAKHVNGMCSDAAINVIITDKEANEHILTELKPFTLYRVVMIATTAYGSSEESSARFEKTKPGAPSDPPRHFNVIRKTNTTIEASWLPPLQTHGDITSYKIRIMRGEIDAQKPKEVDPYHQQTLSVRFENLTPCTIYTLWVVACASSFLCSPANSITVTTEVGVPGSMELPVPEVHNETFVQVSWVPPTEPNGPIDFYTLYMQWEKDEELHTDAINVSDALYYQLSVTCPPDEALLYFFSIQAANVKDGEILGGNRSNPVQSRLCYSNRGRELGLIIGVTVGGAVVLAVIIVALYFVIRWMKKEVDLIKETEVQLPIGLRTPQGDPSYESFKNGLMRKPNDSNLSPKTFYGRLDSYASDDSDPKDRMDPGMAPFGNNSTEELLHNTKDQSEGKHNGGRTNIGQGNDSISSSLTTRTQLSSDSGAETDVQAPPSPESDIAPLCPSQTSPQPTKSSLPKVNKGHSCDSKDSGLEKEEAGSEKENDVYDPNQYSKFVRYLDNPNHPYNRRRQASDKGSTVSQQLPYSKFGVNMPGISGYVPLSTTLALMPRSLANSEPSVVDAEVVNKDNPEDLQNATTNAPAPPYSKYGIGRSLGQSLNMPGSNEADNLGTGYSKFGIGSDMAWLQQPKSPYIAANLASVLLGNKQLSPTLNDIGPTENSKKTSSPLPSASLGPSDPRNKGYVTVDSMNKPNGFFPTQEVNGSVCLPREDNQRPPHSKGYVSVQDVNKMLNDDRKLPKISEAKDQATGIPGYSKFDIQCDRLQNKPDIQMLDPVLTGTKPKTYPSSIHQGYVPCSSPAFNASSVNTPFSSGGSYTMNGDLSPLPAELNLESENSEYEFDMDSQSPSKYLPQSKAKSPSELNNGYVRVKADSSLDGIRIVPSDNQLRSSLTDTAV